MRCASTLKLPQAKVGGWWIFFYVIGVPLFYLILLLAYNVPMVARELKKNSLLRSCMDRANAAGLPHPAGSGIYHKLTCHNIAQLEPEYLDELWKCIIANKAGKESLVANEGKPSSLTQLIARLSSRLLAKLEGAHGGDPWASRLAATPDMVEEETESKSTSLNDVQSPAPLPSLRSMFKGAVRGVLVSLAARAEPVEGEDLQLRLLRRLPLLLPRGQVDEEAGEGSSDGGSERGNR